MGASGAPDGSSNLPRATSPQNLIYTFYEAKREKHQFSEGYLSKTRNKLPSVMLMSQITETENKNLTQKNFYKAGATSSLLAFLAFVLFLIGITSIIATLLQISIKDGWFMQLQDNWLILLFKMNMGFQANLNVINIIDITIMALFCAMFLGLYTALKKQAKSGR